MRTYGTLSRAGDRWVLDTTPPVMIKLKRYFARIKPSRKGLAYITATPEMARDLEWFMGRYPLEMEPKVEEILTAEANEHVESELAADAILEGGRLDKEGFLWEPSEKTHPDQLESADLALTVEGLLICDDVAMGKSYTGLLTTRDPTKLPALIVCQTHLPDQWLDQLELWTPLSGHIGKQMQPYRLANHMPDGKSPEVLILPYSKLAGWAHSLAGRVKTVIFDEVQELRRAGSQKHDAAGLIADRAQVRVGLTATPIYNYGEEAFNILSVVKPDFLGTREEFTREWGVSYGSHTGVKEPGVLARYLEQERVMIRHTWADRGIEKEQPAKVPVTIESDESVLLEFNEEIQRMAEIISSREASREELFNLSGKLDWTARQATGIAKAKYVADFVKLHLEEGKQVLLLGWHHACYDIWRERLEKYNPVMYTGEESPKKKRESKEAFLSGKSKVLVMSVRSGAGLDGLQEACHTCVFGELDWSPQIHHQCIGRLTRPGQTEPVVAYFLVSKHGTDPMMAEVLQTKRMQSDPFLNPDMEILETSQPVDRIKALADSLLQSAAK